MSEKLDSLPKISTREYSIISNLFEKYYLSSVYYIYRQTKMYNMKVVSKILFEDLTEGHRPEDSFSDSLW